MKIYVNIDSWSRYVKGRELGAQEGIISSKHASYPDMLWKGEYEYDIKLTDPNALPSYCAVLRYSSEIFLDKALTIPASLEDINKVRTSTILWD